MHVTIAIQISLVDHRSNPFPSISDDEDDAALLERLRDEINQAVEMVAGFRIHGVRKRFNERFALFEHTPHGFRFREIAGRKYGHILDPRTGRPPKFDGSVTVLTRDAAMADALATALFVMGPKNGLEYARSVDGVEALYVTRDGIKTTVPEDSIQ